MKLVSFWREHKIALVSHLGEAIFEPGLAASSLAPSEEHIFDDAISYIRSGEAGRRILDRLGGSPPAIALHDQAAVTLTAPMLPSTILCAGSNYRDHNAEKLSSPTSGKNNPDFLSETSDCIIGPGEKLSNIIFELTRKLDFVKPNWPLYVQSWTPLLQRKCSRSCVWIYNCQRRHCP